MGSDPTCSQIRQDHPSSRCCPICYSSTNKIASPCGHPICHTSTNTISSPTFPSETPNSPTCRSSATTISAPSFSSASSNTTDCHSSASSISTARRSSANKVSTACHSAASKISTPPTCSTCCSTTKSFHPWFGYWFTSSSTRTLALKCFIFQSSLYI